MNLKEKLQKHKPPKLSLIKLLRNSRDFMERGINSIFNGKRLLRTQEREMSSSTRQVRTMQEPKTISIRKSQILMTTKLSFRENKITTRSLMDL